jgi:DNA-binding transcriptional ArsR family regulator
MMVGAADGVKAAGPVPGGPERGSRMAVTGTAREVAVDAALRAELVELTSTLCHALNDPKRLLILHALANGPSSVGALAEVVEASVANVSQHLAVLRERGLVDSERDGLSVIYSLRYPELIDAITALRGILRTELRRRNELMGAPQGA